MTTDEVNRLLRELLELKREVQESKVQQAIMSTKLDAALAENAIADAVHEKLSDRITTLERGKYMLIGAATVGAALGTGGTAALLKGLLGG